jgi:hypothetical protein
VNRIPAAVCLAVVLAAAACSRPERPAEEAGTPGMADTTAAVATALPPDVALAVELARAVEANPGAADSILAARGLTRAGLDSLMYAIAADSAKAAAYSAALR